MWLLRKCVVVVQAYADQTCFFFREANVVVRFLGVRLTVWDSDAAADMAACVEGCTGVFG